MRMTVVVPDNLVLINGEGYTVENLAALCPENLHALQWYTVYGEEEYRNLINRPITDLSAYVGVIDAWNAAKAAAEAEHEPPADGEPG